jgi:hypothetical protein
MIFDPKRDTTGMLNDNNSDNKFVLSFREEISFLEGLGQAKKEYSADHEKAVIDWAYKQSVSNGEVFQFAQEIARRTLAVYDAYISMQMELKIPPVFDLEMARIFKRTMGMTHQGILQLQDLAKAPEFSNFFNMFKNIPESAQKNIWKSLESLKNSSSSASKVLALKNENPEFLNVIDSFFNIPKELRSNKELAFIRSDNLAVLEAYAHREERLERTLYPSFMHRGLKAADKRDRVLTEINQRNGSFAAIEFTAERSKNPNTYKAGEIADVLTLLFYVDPDLSHIKNSKHLPGRREEAFARKKGISNDAIFRAIMTFMTSQHFFLNEIYKLPKEQFELLNSILNRQHQFKLNTDAKDVIQETLASGGGKYALFSNKNIRRAKGVEEKKQHYQSLEATSAVTINEALMNASELEKLTIRDLRSTRRPTHLFRGGDIFTVPLNSGELQSDHEKAKEYMNQVDQKGYQVIAGISGTTGRNFANVYSLGLLNNQKNQGKLLTACIGFMGPMKHHSVYEIAASLRSFNFPFKYEKGLIRGIEDFTDTKGFSKNISEKVWQQRQEVAKIKSKQRSASRKEKAALTRMKRKSH